MFRQRHVQKHLDSTAKSDRTTSTGAAVGHPRDLQEMHNGVVPPKVFKPWSTQFYLCSIHYKRKLVSTWVRVSHAWAKSVIVLSSQPIGLAWNGKQLQDMR